MAEIQEVKPEVRNFEVTLNSAELATLIALIGSFNQVDFVYELVESYINSYDPGVHKYLKTFDPTDIPLNSMYDTFVEGWNG